MTFRFPEGEDDGQDDTGEADKVVPAYWLAFEHRRHDDGEHCQRHTFLNNLQLHQREGSSVDLAADTVGGNHERVFEESQCPRREDNEYQRPVGVDLQLGELQVTVPCEGHKHVADYEQQYGD